MLKYGHHGTLRFATNQGIGNGAILYSQGKITIGKGSVIWQGANLCTGTHDYTKKGLPLLTRLCILATIFG